MKLKLYCPHCSHSGDRSTIHVEPTNEGRYSATCESGHAFDIAVGYHDFQILFEIAINAIHDGYYREAVGSFTASYERFLEFFVRIAVGASEIEGIAIEQSWKHVKNQSERQLGAFIFAYLLTYKDAPDLLPNPRVAFRNDVIHKGKIPSRAEAVKYGDAVMTAVLRVLRKLWVSHQYEVVGSINAKMFPTNVQPTNVFLPWSSLPTNREPPNEKDAPSVESLVNSIGSARQD
tara:strand:- start:27230 stop:27928 length:699 start_codon:yes stop_codon:yes gene_type:complete